MDYELKLHHENLIKLYEFWKIAHLGERDYDVNQFAPGFRLTKSKLSDIICSMQHWMAHSGVELTPDNVLDIQRDQKDIEELHLRINRESDHQRRYRDGVLLDSSWNYLGRLAGDVDSVRTNL